MKVLVAGSTGYLGSYIVKKLQRDNHQFKAVARNVEKLSQLGIHESNIIKAEVTNKESLQDIFENIDAVISTVGITRQKDNLTYMDVDYGANKNLLDTAIKNGVKKFIYVSVLNGSQLRHTQICAAKEKFVDELKSSGIDYCVIRPSGFFSDMIEFFNMAKKGRIYLFGDGQFRSNPIHGEDLAEICINALDKNYNEIAVGGPEILTQEEIAKIAFDTLRKKSKITYLPDWLRRAGLKIGKFLLPIHQYGPFEFFMNVMAMDLVGETYGKINLYNYYKSLTESNN